MAPSASCQSTDNSAVATKGRRSLAPGVRVHRMLEHAGEVIHSVCYFEKAKLNGGDKLPHRKVRKQHSARHMSPAHTAVNESVCHTTFSFAFSSLWWDKYLLDNLSSYPAFQNRVLCYISDANCHVLTISVFASTKLSAVILLLIIILHFLKIVNLLGHNPTSCLQSPVQLIFIKQRFNFLKIHLCQEKKVFETPTSWNS